ncbi:Probable aldo-keto reductase [Seminavis robusta]|uniref:Probable aldo-keto reductase n=1 Tax=Seminavis robusta TaxID=568900 RepID=A0A9N8DZ14_9STRA|nr:Probable aldo-keto reductase [Seminavis robusta]|eukprot:Sro487_g152750.1 Probable aldo-keto reductase (416) ;mRNA; f:7911-9297
MASLLLLVVAVCLQPSESFVLHGQPSTVSTTTTRLAAHRHLFEDDFSQLSRRQACQQAAMATTTGLILPRSARAATEDQTKTVPTVQLGDSSLEVSRTIQGHWQLAGGHGKIREADALANMEAHYKAGITTLDTADIYGPSEIIMGKFMAKQPNAIPCTKFCCFRFLDEITRDEVRQRITKACEKLQVAKLPLVQYFWLRYDVKKYVDVALWLTELKEEGLIQEIGATNFDLPKLKELKKAGVPIVSHQVQLSALDRRPIQSGMADWCAAEKISLIAFGTVGSGILSQRYLGKPAPTQEQKNTASMRMYSNTAARFGSWSLVQEVLQTMDAIANQVRRDGRCAECTIANVAQRYILQTPAVASVLIGVRNQDHIAENVRTHSFELRQDETDAIDAVVAKRKGPEGDVWDIERGSL